VFPLPLRLSGLHILLCRLGIAVLAGNATSDLPDGEDAAAPAVSDFGQLLERAQDSFRRRSYFYIVEITIYQLFCIKQLVGPLRGRTRSAGDLAAPVDRQRQCRLGDELFVGDRAAVVPQDPFDDLGLVVVEPGSQRRDQSLDVVHGGQFGTVERETARHREG
jgi:hypothetical protein